MPPFWQAVGNLIRDPQSPHSSPGLQPARSELWTRTAGQGSGPQNGERNGERAGRETPLLPATGCEQPQCATKNADDLKSKESHALDALVPHDATGCDERRRRDSNPGWRICNPM